MQQKLAEAAKEQQLVRGLLRDLSRLDRDFVGGQLKDKLPFNRWLAAQVVSAKRYHFEKDLIELLNDPHPLVRQVAQQGLVRLSRGNDFGPPPNNSPYEVKEAQRAWRDWLNLQESPGLADILKN